MAKDPGISLRAIGEVINVKGKCSAGHYAGELIDLSCYDSGGFCGFFYHDIFPMLSTFQFGGNMPWWEGDEIILPCPDQENQVSLKRFPR